MSVGARIRSQLARRAPALEEAAVRTNWRLRNRSRSFSGAALAPDLRRVTEDLGRHGLAVSDAETIFGSGLFDEAAARAQELYAAPRPPKEAAGKGSYLTKLASGSYAADDVFVRLALHPGALQVVNAYLGIRSTLRDLALWLTEPTPGPAIETQLWHRDADDYKNVKMYVYFTDVTRGAGPLCYAPGTHPDGAVHSRAESDERGRATDDQLGRLVPPERWRLAEGSRGSVVFADTSGYHKQQKPETDERLLLMAHYVSGTPYVERVVELRDPDPGALDDDQFVAVFDRVRA